MYKLKTVYKLPSSVFLFNLLKLFALFLFIFLLMGMVFTESHETIAFVFDVLFISLGIISYISYRSVSFSIDKNSISINSGILFKHSISILFNSIQNIDCTKGPLSGLFGLSTLKIWTAASSQIVIKQGKSNNIPDGILTLKSEDILWLKDFILDRKPSK